MLAVSRPGGPLLAHIRGRSGLFGPVRPAAKLQVSGILRTEANLCGPPPDACKAPGQPECVGLLTLVRTLIFEESRCGGLASGGQEVP